MNRGRPARARRMAAMLTAISVSLAVTASTAAATTEPIGTTGAVSEGRTGDPVHGDELRIASPAPATSINPATANVAFSMYTSIAYDSLFYRNADGGLEPQLAESWEMGEGNTRLDITLRDGVTFTDGSPLDAAAVKASLEYMQGAGGGGSQYLAAIESIDVVSDLDLSITLSEASPMLPDLMTPKYLLGQIISPTGLADPDALTVENPSQGVGPYIYNPDDSVAGDHYAYDANPAYYAPERQHYDRIVIQVIADAQATLSALQTGQIDLATGSAETVPQAESAGLQVVQVPFVWQGLNLIDRGGEVAEPLADVRVRQALNYAIDRDTVTAALLGDYGVATDTIVVEGGDGWSQEAADRYPYDPDAARELLADAGYADGFTLEVLSVHFAGIDLMAEAIKGQLAEVGVTLDITNVSDEQSYVAGATDRSYPAVAVGYGAQPVWVMGPGLFLPDAAIFNGFATADDTVTDLYDRAAAAPEDERAELNAELITYLTDQAWFVPVGMSPVFFFAADDIGGLKVSADAPTSDPIDLYDIAG